MMEMRLLEYAVAVYHQGSFTKAAEHLCIAQPSLSQQIAKLERELGVRLFFRGQGSVTPTPEGLHFVKKAEEILGLRNDLEREMKEQSEGMGRELVIGTTAITGGHVLPPLLQAYGERYPDVQVRLVEEATQQLIELTAKGIVDVSILALPIDDTRLTTKAMLTEPLYLALPATEQKWMSAEVRQLVASPASESLLATVPLTALSTAPFILLKEGFRFRQTLLTLCAKSGFQPEIAFETSSIETAQSLVAYGLGVTLVPKMVIKHSNQTRPIYLALDSQPTRTLVFAYHRERYLNLAARSLLDVYDHFLKNV